MRTHLQNVQSSGTNLVDLINNDAAWSWAKNEQNVGQLEKALKTLRGEMKDATIGQVMASSQQQLKMAWGASTLSAKLGTFMGIKGSVDAVDKEITKLWKRHKATREPGERS